MDDTLSTWLQLREPADALARSESLTNLIAAALPDDEPVRVLDLATGTGANLRYLAPRLPGRQRWLVVDRDAALLALMPVLTSSWGAARRYNVRTSANGFAIRAEQLECDVEARQLDLGTGANDDIIRARHLVTASALLDLVSDRWLRALAAQCRSAGTAALFAITYNGKSSCSPVEPEDEMIRDLLNRHQKRDKGLGGPAAGPDAAECAARCFTEAGYVVRTEPSDWTLGSEEGELQRRLIEGWAEAAVQMRADAGTIARWRDRRIAHLEAGRSRIVVGHLDLAATLPQDQPRGSALDIPQSPSAGQPVSSWRAVRALDRYAVPA
jgi:hypothetical protein